MKTLLLLLCSTLASAQYPDAPKPKREALRFVAATVFFAGSTVFQAVAEHHGANLCRKEDARAGERQLFGTGDAFGHRPDNADRREAFITGGVYAVALALELRRHHQAAKRILLYGGAINYGIAGGTYWGGCN